MAFIWSTLNVKNLDESIKFYVELLELEVTNRFKAGPETEIAFLGNQSTKIELIENAGKSSIEIGEDISWGFSVVSLDKIISVLNEKNIPILKGPIQPNPNIKFIYIKDPNGMNIQLVEGSIQKS
ncbi:lactoylglutathione lyase [Acetoanaerobium noterae]|uniref:Lactoylglutathione lyase n=1 Tax=Acetoanaerobium noterae TaxID=745369 RepID=A0A1T4ZSQ8_9FIRM|nr:VOC family protein [Acetoanaerobium noterae]SKB25627.1 lactoylglutathione lyase [Acetoanaerobium noterae]